MSRRLASIYVLVLLIAWQLVGYLTGPSHEAVHLSGQTMGTSYNIVAIGVDLDRNELTQAVEEKLLAINAKLSNWDPNSDPSRLSASDQTGPTAISEEFAVVMAAAGEVHELSAHRFDVTLGPLIELWGFGTRQAGDQVPSDGAIADALEHVGQSRLLRLDQVGLTISKHHASVGVNLGAIAKGYGVDEVAAALRQSGVEHYMVEIGGDLVARGHNSQGQSWRIGIEQPDPGANGVQLVVPVTDSGLATSGDYRNFFEVAGVRYSHILDPTTGRPVVHRTTSVTVVAQNAMLADAWATAMLVLGEEAGLSLANQLDLAVFFITKGASGSEGTYITVHSNAFSNLMATE